MDSLGIAPRSQACGACVFLLDHEPFEAEAVGLEPTSGPRPPPVFKTGPSSGRMASVRLDSEFRGLDSNQRPPRSGRGVTTDSNCPGVREGGLEPPPPDSKSGSLPISRFPRAPRGSRTRLSDLASPRLTARPGTHRINDCFECGIGESNPGRLVGSQESCHWTNPADFRRKGRESNPQGLSPRPGSNRVPSPVGLPLRFTARPFTPSFTAFAGGCDKPHPSRGGRI